MDKELKIRDKELLAKKLDQEVDELKTTRRNLETQIISLNKQKDLAGNVDEAQHQNRRNTELKELSNSNEKLVKEKNEYIRRNQLLAEQRLNLETKEKSIGDVRTQLKKLQDERMEVYELRKEANKLLDRAKIEHGEIEGFKQSWEGMKQNLESQINLNKKTYNEYMDLVGEVNERLKAVKIREANCEAIEMKYEKQEVTNVT